MPAPIINTSAFSFFTASRTASTYLFPFTTEASSTLQTYNTGLLVNNCRSLAASCCKSSNTTVRADNPFSKAALYRWSTSTKRLAPGSPPVIALFSSFCKRLSTVSKSFNCNSVSIISLSLTGSTLPSTCTILSSSKQRNTWIIASVSRMLERNLLPNPSPFTRPAISTISTTAGTTFCGFTNSTSLFNRSSGTVITPTLGSIVQKGKLADCAFALLKQLNKVDFPTFGSPTIPHCKPIIYFIFIITYDSFPSGRAKIINFER